MKKLLNKKNEDGEKGMMTVEMVFALTMFAAFFTIMLSFINCIYLQQKVQASLRTAAIQASRDYYALQSLEDQGRYIDNNKIVKVYNKRGSYLDGSTTLDATNLGAKFDSKQALMLSLKDSFRISSSRKTSLYGPYYSLTTDYYKNMGVVGGFDGISFDKTELDPGTGTINVVASYKIRIIDFPLLGNAGINVDINQCASTKLWQ